MNVDVLHHVWMEHQCAEAQSRLYVTSEDSSPIANALPGMAVFVSPSEHEKGATKTRDVIDDYDMKESNFLSSGLPAVCSIEEAN